ncbi:MAG: glycosyltransferase family 1 protein [Candidatus Omnitrophica bacterium]|nr:glycosyltransferase family 1 protein [Candidatus Omnitrophota bacterium]
MMTLCLFLTYGISLKRWDELGILERELALYEKLSKRGIQVSIFTYGDKQDLDYTRRFPGFRIFPAYAHLPKPKNKIGKFFQSLTFAQKFSAFFQEQDLLKTNQMWGAWVPLSVQSRLNKPLILRAGYEAYLFSKLEKVSRIQQMFTYIVSRIAYQKADRIILSSQSAKTFVLKTFPVESSRIDVIPNAVDLSRIPDLSGYPVQLPHRTIIIGRLEEQKNLFNAIAAAATTSIGLDIIGAGSLKEKLEIFAKEKSADVRFLGTMSHSEMIQKISQYLFCLLPSYYEGSPKALLEMMACGRAVIGARVQGIEEIIQDGETGMLTGTSAEEIAQGMRPLIQSPELCREMGAKARRYAEDHFSLEVLQDREYQLYQPFAKKPVCLV